MENTLHYAGFWRRTSASLVDILILAPILIFLVNLLGIEKTSMIEIDENLYSFVEDKKAVIIGKIVDLVSLVIVATYSVLLISSKRKATIGKRIFGIYVVDEKGHKISKQKALARFFAGILSILTFGIGLLMIAFTKEKTALHDMICSTRVIKKNKKDE